MSTQVKDHLNQVSNLQRSCYNSYGVAQFLLDHGMAFSIGETSFPQLGEFRECFKNSLRMAVEDPTLIYCEGYALAIIPVYHAWCVTSQGVVVDPTWESGDEYFGVGLQTQFVSETSLRLGYYGNAIDNFRERWPLLTGKIQLSTALHPEFEKLRMAP